MNARSARIVVTVAAFLAGLVLCFGVILVVTGRLSAPVAQQAAAIGGPFKLTDQNGKTVTDQDLKGRPFLVFFGFTHCPDICPTTLFDVSEIMRALGKDADRVGALFITVDPERDTSAALKDYLSSFDPHLVGPHRRAGRGGGGGQGLPRLFQEGAARPGRLHHGPHRDRLSDGQGRTLRLAVQPQADDRRGRRRPAPTPVNGFNLFVADAATDLP